MDNTNFVDSENHINKSSMIDEHQIIEIIEKNPILPKDIGRIVCGDSNSNILTFEISILLGKICRMHYVIIEYMDKM